MGLCGGEREKEKKRERFVFTPRAEKKNMVICQGDSTLKHPNYSDKATLFWCWIKYE